MDDPRRARLAGQAEDALRAADVDPLHLRRLVARDADPVDGSEVEGRVGAVEAATDRVRVVELALDQLAAELPQVRGAGRRPDERDDVVAAAAERAHEHAAHEARTARDEGAHGGTLDCPRVRVCLMVEGQEGVTWAQWLALAEACEEAGLEGLYRSDHYLSIVRGGEAGSLDAWATIAALAARTERIRLGTLVSPVTFRPAAVLAKSVGHRAGDLRRARRARHRRRLVRGGARGLRVLVPADRRADGRARAAARDRDAALGRRRRRLAEAVAAAAARRRRLGEAADGARRRPLRRRVQHRLRHAGGVPRAPRAGRRGGARGRAASRSRSRS